MSAEPDYDAEIMLRLRNGEETALNELMARWQQPLVSFIYRYVGNQSDALDLAQETFVRVFENRKGYKPKAKFSTWLFSIAANLCHNLVRWRNRHPTVALTHDENDADHHDLLETLPSLERSPADTASSNDLANAVRQHVQELPHDLKTVVLLFEFEDLSYEEIARVLGCSTKAVESRLYRARNILRDRLTRWKIA